MRRPRPLGVLLDPIARGSAPICGVDFNHLRVAGDGTSGSDPLPASLAESAIGRRIFRVYGLIPPNQAVPAGEYFDVIEVVVTF